MMRTVTAICALLATGVSAENSTSTTSVATTAASTTSAAAGTTAASTTSAAATTAASTTAAATNAYVSTTAAATNAATTAAATTAAATTQAATTVASATTQAAGNVTTLANDPVRKIEATQAVSVDLPAGTDVSMANTQLKGVLQTGLENALGLSAGDVTITSLSGVRMLRELSAALRKLESKVLTIGYEVATTQAAATALKAKMEGTGAGSLVQDLGAAIVTAANAVSLNMTVNTVTAASAQVTDPNAGVIQLPSSAATAGISGLVMVVMAALVF